MTAVLTPPPPAPAPTPRRASGRSRRLQQLIPLLLMLAGIVLLLYPVAATQFNNIKQREFSQQYNQDVQQADPVDLQADVDAARAYNTKLEGVPILDPWLLRASGPPSSDAYALYASLLNRFDVMARVKVPTAEIDLPVYHGTTDDVIAKGAGHLYGTSLPVGGPDSHAVLTSHTGMASATLFDHLVDVKEGDLMFVEVSGETLAYQVNQIKIILPTEIGDLTKVEGHDYLTLFTCTPYSVNTHRLLVRGERVPYTPQIAEAAKAAEAPVFKMEWWMWGLIAGAVAGLMLLIAIVVLERRRARGRPVVLRHAAGEPVVRRGLRGLVVRRGLHEPVVRRGLPEPPASRPRGHPRRGA